MLNPTWTQILSQEQTTNNIRSVIEIDESLIDNNEYVTKKKYQRGERITNIGGQPYWMPNGFTHMPGNVEKTNHASHDTLKEIKTTMKKQLHHNTLQDKLRIGTLAGRLPHIPNAAMETCLAASGINLTIRTEMYSSNVADTKNIMSFDGLTNISPCRITINDYCIETAAHKVILCGNAMEKSDGLYISYDKVAGVLCK